MNIIVSHSPVSVSQALWSTLCPTLMLISSCPLPAPSFSQDRKQCKFYMCRSATHRDIDSSEADAWRCALLILTSSRLLKCSRACAQRASHNGATLLIVRLAPQLVPLPTRPPNQLVQLEWINCVHVCYMILSSSTLDFYDVDLSGREPYSRQTHTTNL